MNPGHDVVQGGERAPGAAPLEQLLVERFFRGDAVYLASSAGKADLANHLHARSAKYRALYADWLRSCLAGSPGRVLEIGVGTGCASLVLAECGFAVDGLELDAGHAQIASARLAAAGHGFGRLFLANAADQLPTLDLGAYDAVIFWASLEHMTLDERLASLGAAWAGMQAGARLMVLECPNRLWYRDTHTSLEPFFHWLPDALARRFLGAGQGSELDLARAGRGASHHEFLLAGIPVGRERRISALQAFKRRNVLKALKWRLNGDGRYERRLHALAGAVHRAFFHEYLEVCLTK
jgi:S-adenosylmethionine-dependent methyltransferase